MPVRLTLVLLALLACAESSTPAPPPVVPQDANAPDEPAELPTYRGRQRHFGPPGPDGGPLHPILGGWFFRPPGPAPPTGFPCVAVARLAGYRVSGAVERLTPETGLPYRLVHEAGIAVFFVHLPPVRSDDVPGLAPTDQSELPFDPARNQLGPPYPRGHGVIVPATGVVGEDWPGPPPPGYEGVHPWLDPGWLMPEKSAAWIVQHLRHHGRQGTGELPVDGARLGLDGSSSGGTAMLFPALMPDLAGRLSGADDPAGRASTRVAGVRVGGAPVYWPVFRQDGRNVRFRAYHFAHLDSAPAHDAPAVDFRDATRDDHELVVASPAVYGSDLGPETGLTALNRSVRLYLAYNEPSHPRLLATPDRWRPPYPEHLEQTTHPVSHGYILKALYPDNARLVIGKPEAVDELAATTGGGEAHDALITDKGPQLDDQLAWWSAVLAADG